MKNILSDQDHALLDQRIKDVEKRMNAQIVLAVIKRSDSYAELPWKAFALGASAAGLLIFILDLLSLFQNLYAVELIAVVSMLFGGAVLALLTVFAPRFARIFLSEDRAEVEVGQYAESIFLKREMFATSGRTGILLLVSMFEKQVVILPDKGLDKVLNTEVMKEIIKSMGFYLKQNEIYRAMEAGLEHLVKTLEGVSLSGGGNELPDEIIEEDGV